MSKLVIVIGDLADDPMGHLNDPNKERTATIIRCKSNDELHSIAKQLDAWQRDYVVSWDNDITYAFHKTIGYDYDMFCDKYWMPTSM